MSSLAISSSASSLLSDLSTYKAPTKQNAFDQLGKDLQSGNLAAAKSDFAVMTGDSSTSATTTATTSQDPVVQDIVTLGKDLNSGDLAAANQDYTTLKSDLKTELSLVATTASKSNEDTETKALLKILQSFTASPSKAISAYASNGGTSTSSSTSSISTSSSTSSSSTTSTSDTTSSTSSS
jgi:hypothetical protein